MRLTKAGVLLGLLTFGAVCLWTWTPSLRASADPVPAQAIVCLSAGLRADGQLGVFSRQRAETCIDLYHRGFAPVIAFTGGVTRGQSPHDVPATARQMANLARAKGIPLAAIVVEDRSLSTLQNALFTLPLLPDQTDMILVTDRFHLPRAMASFYWAGARNLQGVSAKGAARTAIPGGRLLGLEAVKIWGNLLRAQAFGLADLLPISSTTKNAILR